MKILKQTDYTYFFNPENNEKLKKYEPGAWLRTELDNIPRVFKTTDLVYDSKSKWLFFDHGSDRYVIENPYDHMLIRAGYLVLDDYDSRFVSDKEEGWSVHNELISIIKHVISTKINPDSFDDSDESRITFTTDIEEYNFKIIISSINVIVNKNQERKINNLQFYPFDKAMDKYGTVYCAIYAARRDGTERPASSRHNIADDILQRIVSGSERVKYAAMELKNPVYYIL